MKIWIKRTLIGIGAAAVLLGGIAAFADRDHHGHRWQQMSESDAAGLKARVIEKAGSKLDLDEAQKARLGVLVDRLREQRNDLIGQTGDPRSEMKAMVSGPTFDRARAEAMIIAKTDALRSKAPEVIAAAADFYDGLRPEQQAQLRSFIDRGRRDHRGERSDKS